MKTSKIVMIATASLLISLWIVMLLVARKDIESIMAENAVIEYRQFETEPFERIEFSGSWEVRIKQGKDCKVEWGTEDPDDNQPAINNETGTLHLSAGVKTHAVITAPLLKEIRATGNTHIEMKNYWTDTIRVVLGDSCTYSGSKNDFKYISFKGTQ